MKELSTQRKGVALWLGGTSSLARTYVNQFGPHNLVFSGLESRPPQWVQEQSIPFVSLDLTRITDAQVAALVNRFRNIATIVVGVRPLLFAPYTRNTRVHDPMVRGLEIFLNGVCNRLKEQLKFVLHISSVAAANHLQSQEFWSETDTAFPQDVSGYRAPYDRFKRRSEEEITEICEKHQVPCCHLRLSAIFSDEASCIQCSALELQYRIGCYLPLAIDCNSSANVSRAIDLILARAEKQHDGDGRVSSIKTVYYYTRPLSLERVPYGYYLQEFRRAYRIYSFWIPVWVVTWFVTFVHWLAAWNNFFYIELPYLDAADYLLQVASREHSFDCSRFGRDFPELVEESIFECFTRRKAVLESYRRAPNSSIRKQD